MIAEIAEKLKNFFEDRKEVQFAILFGSLAKDTANVMSDVDIAVMIDPKFNGTFPYGYQAALTTDLMQLLRRNDVDVIILNDIPIVFKHQILRYGKFIYTRDEQARIKFQIDTINRYEDFKMIYKIHEEACHQRWRKLALPETMPTTRQ